MRTSTWFGGHAAFQLWDPEGFLTGLCLSACAVGLRRASISWACCGDRGATCVKSLGYHLVLSECKELLAVTPPAIYSYRKRGIWHSGWDSPEHGLWGDFQTQSEGSEATA